MRTYLTTSQKASQRSLPPSISPLLSCPFAVQAQPQPSSAPSPRSADLATPLQQAARAGHHLAYIAFTPLPAHLVRPPKRTIGPPRDPYEQQADRMAVQVMRQLDHPVSQAAPLAPAVQCQPQEDHALQRKREAGDLQPEAAPDLQGRPRAATMTPFVQRVDDIADDALQRASVANRPVGLEGGPAPADMATAIAQARSGGEPLPERVRALLEPAFGTDFSGVKVHTDAVSDTLNRSIHARAFTTGQDIFFREGEYAPESPEGQKLIVHELTHVVQQKQRLAPPARSLSASPHTSPLIQPKIGFEFETNVPIDRLTKPVADYKNLRELAPAGDFKGQTPLATYKGITYKTDHSQALWDLMYPTVNPPKTASPANIELETPPVEESDESAVKGIIANAQGAAHYLSTLTDGLTTRQLLPNTAYHVGPLNNTKQDGVPPGISLNASAQVNVGIDLRQFRALAQWGGGDPKDLTDPGAKYSTKHFKNVGSLTWAPQVAGEVVDHFRNKVQSAARYEPMQGMHGIEGMLTLLALYILSGVEFTSSRPSRLIKNFSTVISKSNLQLIFQNGLTADEKTFWSIWEKDIQADLLARINRITAQVVTLTATSHIIPGRTYSPTIDQLFRFVSADGGRDPMLDILYAQVNDRPEGELAPEAVGPSRIVDRVARTNTGRRIGPVVEFRAIPGRIPPAEWEALALHFSRKLTALNTTYDYEELALPSLEELERPAITPDVWFDALVQAARPTRRERRLHSSGGLFEL